MYVHALLFQIENKELRDLLVISKTSVSVKMTATEENSQPAAAAATTTEQVKPPETECKEWSDQLDIQHQETGFMITLPIFAT